MSKKDGDSLRLRVARALAVARLSENMGQQELAELVGTKKSSISRIERGGQNITVDYVEEIARALHMSKSALYKVFTRQFKTPIMTYVRTQKCMLARDLIHDGMSATEAAEKLGFAHYSSFYRDYIQVFGSPPTERRA